MHCTLYIVHRLLYTIHWALVMDTLSPFFLPNNRVRTFMSFSIGQEIGTNIANLIDKFDIIVDAGANPTDKYASQWSSTGKHICQLDLQEITDYRSLSIGFATLDNLDCWDICWQEDCQPVTQATGYPRATLGQSCVLSCGSEAILDTKVKATFPCDWEDIPTSHHLTRFNGSAGAIESFLEY